MTTQPTSQIIEGKKNVPALKKIVVGHDFSDAADSALAGAMSLARLFHAEIVVAHAAGPSTNESGGWDFSANPEQAQAQLENLASRVTRAGFRCKSVMLPGPVAATLRHVVDEEGGDLLMLGAYGNGSDGRTTLGSNTERLLRSIPCPVLTYGPKVTRPLSQKNAPFSILVPIELPCDPRCLRFAIDVAKLFKAKLEVLHVVDMDRAASMPHAFQDMQYACEDIAAHLRTGDAEVAGSLLFGKPDKAIISRCQELKSSLIVVPLETRERLSSRESDNVAASVIRSADVPVMTYRIN